MKKISAKSKIICALVLVIVIAGVVMVALKGFKIDLKNQASQQIKLYIKKPFEIADIEQMTNEVFEGQQIMIQKVEVYEDTVSVIATEITDEQKSSMIQKVNEKYEADIKDEDVTIEDIPHTELLDIVKPYIVPLVIATSIILVYVGIRYYKIGMIKTILKTGGVLVIAEVVLFAVMAIARLPIGRLTLPLVLFVYLITALCITTNLENKLKEKSTEENA